MVGNTLNTNTSAMIYNGPQVKTNYLKNIVNNSRPHSPHTHRLVRGWQAPGAPSREGAPKSVPQFMPQ